MSPFANQSVPSIVKLDELTGGCRGMRYLFQRRAEQMIDSPGQYGILSLRVVSCACPYRPSACCRRGAESPQRIANRQVLEATDECTQVARSSLRTSSMNFDVVGIRAAAHERDHDLIPARRLLETALAEAATAGLPDIVLAAHLLLGVIEHKEENSAEASRPPRAWTPHGTRRGDPAGALAQFRRTLAIAPGTGTVNLAGNALSGMGVALLALLDTDEVATLPRSAVAGATMRPRSHASSQPAPPWPRVCTGMIGKPSPR